MNLTKRLEVVASLISDDTNVIDVGCDHAYLDIFLTLNRNNINCYACDINKNALSIAKNNISKYKLENKIKTFLCDGLTDVPIIENSIIVITGMGASTILHILDDERISISKEIIIQSNNDLEKLRCAMVKKGYFICDERSVIDRNKYYVIIKFKKGKKKYNKYEYKFGPMLIKNKENNIDYFGNLLAKYQNNYKKIPKKYLKLKIKTFFEIKKIMKLTK